MLFRNIPRRSALACDGTETVKKRQGVSGTLSCPYEFLTFFGLLIAKTFAPVLRLTPNLSPIVGVRFGNRRPCPAWVSRRPERRYPATTRDRPGDPATLPSRDSYAKALSSPSTIYKLDIYIYMKTKYNRIIVGFPSRLTRPAS